MCDFTPVRNWLIGVLIVVSLAVASSWIAYDWLGRPLITSLSFSLAAMFALIAGVFLLCTLRALRSFCTCAAAVQACRAPCTRLRSGLIGAMFPVLALFILTIRAAAYVSSASRVHTGLYLVTAVLAVITIFIALQARGLSVCQASRAT